VNVRTLDPLADTRWPGFVRDHPQASVFHSREWLEALRRTYRYEPIAYTTSPPDSALTNAIVLCAVRSWLTGRRLVSVPFADHCQPLFDTQAAGEAILAELRQSVTRGRWKYVELRPLDMSPADITASAAKFYFHLLDLGGSLDDLFRQLHKDSMQRKIRRAEREALTCEWGTSPELVRAVYDLQVMTRQRHRRPPQPLAWFRTLVSCLGDRASVGIARKDGRPVAGMVLLRHRDTLVYKYGASDAASHPLGSMPFLFWQAIQFAKSAGARTLDLGRSDTDNDGLVTFKDRLGAARQTLTYRRYPEPAVQTAGEHHSPGHLSAVSRLIGYLPRSVLVTTGRLLYRHVG
jgi:hypothetical protein